MTSRNPLWVAACACVAWALVACASGPPPKAQLADAEMALRAAEQANAAEEAPLDMRKARDKLAAAQAATSDDRNLEARRLAEEATVDAQVAEMKARSATAEKIRDEMQSNVNALREEGQRALERGQ